MKRLIQFFLVGVAVIFLGKIAINLLPEMLELIEGTIRILFKAAWYVLVGYIAMRIWNEIKRRRAHG